MGLILLTDEQRATTRLYLITPPALDPHEFAPRLEAALSGGDVAAVQLRLKDVDDETIRAAAARLQPIVQERGVAFIMNDRPDLAAELDCDGVHIGEEDWPYAPRAAGGRPRPRRRRRDLRRESAPCAGGGAKRAPITLPLAHFSRARPKSPNITPGPEVLKDWSDMTVVPCCAIGGITQENCGPLVEAGADFLAVIGAIWNYPKGPKEAVADFNAVFAKYGRAYG